MKTNDNRAFTLIVLPESLNPAKKHWGKGEVVLHLRV